MTDYSKFGICEINVKDAINARDKTKAIRMYTSGRLSIEKGSSYPKIVNEV